MALCSTGVSGVVACVMKVCSIGPYQSPGRSACLRTPAYALPQAAAASLPGIWANIDARRYKCVASVEAHTPRAKRSYAQLCFNADVLQPTTFENKIYGRSGSLGVRAAIFDGM